MFQDLKQSGPLFQQFVVWVTREVISFVESKERHVTYVHGNGSIFLVITLLRGVYYKVDYDLRIQLAELPNNLGYVLFINGMNNAQRYIWFKSIYQLVGTCANYYDICIIEPYLQRNHEGCPRCVRLAHNIVS
jgi:hypothetical protein